VHAVTERLRIDGEVGGSVWAAGESLTLDADGRVGRDASFFGDHAVFEGAVGRDLAFAGERLELRGGVGRDVEVLHARRLALRDGARVGGDVEASLHEPIETDPGALVQGEITTSPARVHGERFLARYRTPAFWALALVEVVAAFLFGLATHALAPGLLRAGPPTTPGFFRSLGAGFVAVLAAPVAIALCALTIVGIPLAVVGLFAFLTALYLAVVLVSVMVGRALRPPADEGLRSVGVALLIGTFVVQAALHVPFLGLPLGIVAVLFGLGHLVQRGLARAGFARAG
jgi:cytoskeletal protein CcmA (bactofilin family)